MIFMDESLRLFSEWVRLLSKGVVALREYGDLDQVTALTGFSFSRSNISRSLGSSSFMSNSEMSSE